MHGVETANLVFDYFSVEDIRMVTKLEDNLRISPQMGRLSVIRPSSAPP